MLKGLIALAVVVVLFTLGSIFWPASIQETTSLAESIAETVTGRALPGLALVSRLVTFEDGSQAAFDLASDFAIAVAAEGLGKPRFMAFSPDGRLFVPDMVNYNLSHEGRLFVLEDFNEKTKKFETINTYLSRLRGPNSVAFYQDGEGNTWLYLALTEHLIRYPYKEGDTKPSGEGEVIIEFPNSQTPGETSVVWHITRTIVFHDGRAYIAVGSGCNSCEQLPGALRGLIFSINPDGSDVEVYADGLRNAVGIEWAEGVLYATANGVDHLGASSPDDGMYRITKGEHYGWPYCYELNGVVQDDDSKTWTEAFSCGDAPHYLAAFGPHTAPLGLTYFKNAHEALEGAFLVAEHGSFNAGIGTGYQVTRVSKEGAQEVFMTGFLREDGWRIARPVDFLQKDENSFFMTDDHAGRIFYVYAR